MKFPMACLTCQIEHPGEVASLRLLSIQEDSRYEVVCEQGHRDFFVLQNPKFDILFEIGAHAILDGYYREAVSSFQASLERCHEYFIRAALRQRSMPDDIVTKAWKEVGKQSERQLGGFIMLYTVEFGGPPPLLSNKKIEVRNAVIHQGRIPQRQEAVDYGQAVLDIERRLLRDMRGRYAKAMTSLTLENMAKLRKPEEVSVGGAALSTIVGFQGGESIPDGERLEKVQGTLYHERPLELALSELLEHRAFQTDIIARK
jgi:hypothetical protein